MLTLGGSAGGIGAPSSTKVRRRRRANIPAAPAELKAESMKYFLESLRVLGLCVREAPEFAAKKRRKAAASLH